ncbi:MAG TPA: phage tail tube protein [Gammaproteobacteria bacterium]|nr:phage tail tube protein [Gammaproteobacteria bacterium]
MSSTNRVALSLIREAVLGALPTNPIIRAQRITGAPNLGMQPSTITSNEIRPDRQITDLILVGSEAGGDEAFELSFRSQDDLLEGAMFNRYVRQPYREGATITSIAAGSATVTDTTAGGGGSFAAGDIVYGEGFAVAANNGLHVLTAGSATSLTAATFALEAVVPSAAKLIRVGRRGASGDIVAVTAGGTRLTSTTLNFTTLGLQVGQWIKIGNANVVDESYNTAAANAFARITSITANALGLFVDSTFAADTGAGKTIGLYFSDFLTNGVTRQSFAIEERFTDHNPETVQVVLGNVIDTLSIEFEPQAIVTGTATFFGTTGAVYNPVAPGDYSNIYSGAVTREVAPASQVLNTSTNVARFARGGTRIVGPNYIRNFTFEIVNNLRRLEAVGVFGAADVGEGEFSVTGDIETYFGDKSMLEAVVNNTETSLDCVVRDNDFHAYVFDLPRLKFSEGQPDVPGKNDDVTINLSYQAIRHATLGYTASVSRFFYAR